MFLKRHVVKMYIACSQLYNERNKKMFGHYHRGENFYITTFEGKDRASSLTSIKVPDGYDLPRGTGDAVLRQYEVLQRQRSSKKEDTDALQHQGSRENYGPPTIKYQAKKEYDTNEDRTIRAISGIDRQSDQGVKYVGVGDDASIKNQEVHYEQFNNKAKESLCVGA